MTLFSVMFFLTKKPVNFASEFIFSFSVQINIQKLGYCLSFWGVSNEKLYVTPRKELENESYYIAYYIKKVSKDVSSFRENSKSCQNYGLFEVGVMGSRIYPIR